MQHISIYVCRCMYAVVTIAVLQLLFCVSRCRRYAKCAGYVIPWILESVGSLLEDIITWADDVASNA